METLTILLKASWQGWLNTIRHPSEERPKRIWELVGFLVLVAALYLMGRAIFGVAKEQLGEAHGQTILQAINLFMTLGVFILAKDAMEGTIKQLYEAKDTSLFLSSPLSPSTVFGFKLIQIIASNLLSMVIWLLPPWIAFGQLFDLPLGFYLTLIPTCFCLLVIIISEMVIVMMLIVRFFSSRRMIQFLKILGTSIGIAAGFLLSISFLTLDQSDRVAHFLLATLKIPASDWYPHLWAAKLMMSWLPGSEIQAWRWAIQLTVASVGVPVLGVLLASKVYYRSWEYARRVEVTARRKDKKRARFSLLGRGKLRTMMAKDFLVFIRNKGRMTMVVMLTLILLIVMFGATYEMRKGNGDGDAAPISLFGLGVQIMLYSIMATIGLTWGGFKVEAKTWWMLKSGPISPELLFNSKFFIATLCAVTYTNVWICLGLILFRVSVWLWLPILLTTTAITAAATAFNTAIGTLPWVAEIGKTDRDSGKRPVLRIGTILFTMIMNAVILVGLALLMEIVVLGKIQLFGEASSVSISPLQQLTVVGTLSVLIAVWGISYLMGRRFLRKLLYR
ncbi:MAG: hypothetical protein O7E52_21945 [Candidatus Poribacteria bacterium]|nr:hypothetical protein [Candidatus Poribacteria bacterium]